MSAPVLGIDISHHNGRWAPGLLPGDPWSPNTPNARFVLAKATEGKTYVDPRYSLFRDQATEAGLRWGAYHVWRETSGARDQAEHFLKTARLRPGDVAALDLETRWVKATIALRGIREARMLIALWLHRVSLEDCTPLLYVSVRGLKALTNGWREHLGDMGGSQHGTLAEYPLWLCQYVTLANYRPKRMAKGPTLPPTHTTWALWQYTSSGPGKAYGFASSKVDLNLLNGGLEQWDRMAVRPYQAKASGR